MLLSYKEITLLGFSFILLFLIIYFSISFIYVIFYFSDSFENNLIKFVNDNIQKINKRLKIKKNKNIYEFTKDLLIVSGCSIGLLIIFLFFIVYMNLDLFVDVVKEFGNHIAFNILCFILINVPFYFYIIYYSSSYVRFDLSEILGN